MTDQTRSAFVSGFFGSLPFVTVIIPFAMLFGVVATEAGLDLLQTMSMSFFVIAGASQFVAVQLLADQAPTLIILASALAVNMRMAMYSAALVPHLGAAPLWQRAFAAYLLVDQSYGIAIKRYEEDPPLGRPQKMAYFFGTIVLICPLWYLFTWIGAEVGTAIPPEYALDFAVPITFIALIAPQLKSLAHLAAALVSVVTALALAWMPYSTGVLVAAVAAMATGAAVEIWMERRR
ncbi:branched-chain amino acid ABC transporter permease [Halovulum dunhuangense]|uniref:Branched-chain amino acid ABC transporter permease n=1 Tax=Halovulum dunhuangense TaxID=1505036 RepID=A0A849KRX4_9RHOB|nr:AzlC family ABC transporter permease [Halovulum dunhuangense]NNU79619.1 branched-chain amino acid ABC transporter permease [Halovulum dunhuangense]